MNVRNLNTLLIALCVIVLAAAPLYAHLIPMQEWEARYNGPANGADEAAVIAVDADGNVYVGGSSYGVGTGYDFTVIKYSPAGVLLWEDRHNSGFNWPDRVDALVLDASANVYATGTYGYASGPEHDILTIKYDTDGNIQWMHIYDGPLGYDTYAEDIALDSDGNVFVATTSHEASQYYYILLKYSNDGVLLWEVYHNPGPGQEWPSDMALDSDDNVYITGYCTESGSDHDFLTVKYDNDGAVQWSVVYDGPAGDADEGLYIAVDGDANVYVAGYSVENDTDPDYTTIKYNSAGVLQWVKRYDAANESDYIFGLGLDLDGNVYVAGHADFNPGATDILKFVTIKYDADGVELWQRIYEGGAEDSHCSAMTLDSQANVYVTGMNYVDEYDYITVKYNTEGNFQWDIRYAGPVFGRDKPNAIVTDADLNVYVTGESVGDGTDYDFATIKYCQISPITVTLAPVNPPIVIPANGGSFAFDISVENISEYEQTFDIWCNVELPAGQQCTVLGPIEVIVNPLQSITRLRSQAVPPVAPAGEYMYWACVGYPPWVIMDYDNFCFTKEGTDDSWEGLGGWICSGELFPGEDITTEDALPAEISLLGAYPNPFNPTTTISYQLPASSLVSLSIYDITGRQVTELVNGWRDAGNHEVTFDASDLPSGMYIYNLTAGEYQATGKVVLVK
ncbi:hypothetical protein CEE37_14890 [candidate division LCP-89 bacterium B3_LCP]|uniref:Secretion system C-terminal sorting domain-containing protein n=1 Tax=candidate division LCP-89 bacterium B3_LCP TaxID=2012998 RepID=A0A532UNN3_UNCL8|nr:MAG: hypothetical protein CEE37_14890 [candidate division LCP-89 bacterium B3_LCP]